MKYSKWIAGGALVAAVVIVTVLSGNRKSRSAESTAVPSERAEIAAQPQPAKLKSMVRNPVLRDLTARKPAPASPNAEVETAPPVRVHPDQVLAVVNGHPIRLKDLLPFVPENTEIAMTAEQYESRLNRAIEMELTFQAAKVRAVELTAEQQKRLNRIKVDHQATFLKREQEGISWSSVNSAQLEFERRLTSALMLQQNLVAKDAAVAPGPDVTVQARYEQALRDFLARLKAGASISTSVPVL